MLLCTRQDEPQQRRKATVKNHQAYYKVELREIDALRDSEGNWIWNESYVLADDIIFCEAALTPRTILKSLRDWGYLSPASKGRVRVVDEGELIEIQEKSTGRPILALLLCERY